MQTQEVIEGWRGVMVSVGLGKCVSRAACAGVVTGIVCYALKFPQGAFRRDGTIRPARTLSAAQDATHTHFLLTPIAVASAVYLFT